MVKPKGVNLKMESLMVKEFVISLMVEVIRENLMKEELRVKGDYKFPDGNFAKGIWKNNKPWDVIGTLETGEVNGYYENGDFVSVENKTKLI